MAVLHRLLRLLTLAVSGIVSAALLVGFVLALSTMPPVEVYRDYDALIGYDLQLDTAQWQQNFHQYWKTLDRGSLGKSRTGKPAAEVVSGGLQHSLLLVSVSLVLAVVLGVLKGIWDFYQLRRWRSPPGPLVTGALQGLPDFWVILMLQFLAGWMYRTLDWSPFRVRWSDTDPVASMVYPIIALSLVPMAHIARITTTAMLEVYSQDYIRTARSKGLRERVVLFRHAFRNAAVRILDGLLSVTAILFSNLLVVEYLFDYPGLTLLLKEAVDLTGAANLRQQLAGRIASSADVPVLALSGIALGLIFALIYVGLNLIRRMVDPRLKERDLT